MSKAIRHITKFDFESDGSAIHLVHKNQGGAANGIKTLIKKASSTKDLPEVEDISIEKKLEQIKVTMGMEEFLRKFFNMYYDDAELLTAMLGLKTEYEAYVESSDENQETSYMDYLSDKLSGFEIMKSMHEGSKAKTGMDYVNVLETQELFENNYKEEDMMDKISIEKSRFEELEVVETNLQEQLEISKSLKTEVETLTEELAEIKKAKEAVEFADMQGKIKELVAEDKLERMTKSLMAMDSEDADAFIDSLQSKNKAVEESELFVEKSSGGEPETISEEEIKLTKMKEALNKSLSK